MQDNGKGLSSDALLAELLATVQKLAQSALPSQPAESPAAAEAQGTTEAQDGTTNEQDKPKQPEKDAGKNMDVDPDDVLHVDSSMFDGEPEGERKRLCDAFELLKDASGKIKRRRLDEQGEGSR